MRVEAHLLLAVALALVSAAIVRGMIGVGTLDHPGARSSHTAPTPKGGGVGIAAAFILGLAILYAGANQARLPQVPFLGLIAASIGIAAISYADDSRDFPFSIKLGAQLAAALTAIACGIRLRVLHMPVLGAVDLGWWGVPLTAAWIVFATNAVNFIDGLNGLASGSVAIACLFLAAIAWAQGDYFTHIAALLLASGIAGFLPFNFPRARIFMGDVGSQFAGFVVAVLAVLAAKFGAQTLSVLLVPMLLAGIWFDVVFTLARRWWSGERITQAHRSHLYQLAHRTGVPDWAVTLVHWSMVVWGGLCCLPFASAGSRWKPAAVLAVLGPQIAWLAYVAVRTRRAGLESWK